MSDERIDLEIWKRELFESESFGAALTVDRWNTTALNLGAVRIFDGSDASEHITLLNQFSVAPRVDVHCHLLDAFQMQSSDAESIRRAYDALRRCGYELSFTSELTLKALLDPLVTDACGQRVTSGNNVVAFILFSLSNNSIDAVPYVLGAAMRAPGPDAGLLEPSSLLAPINAIAVPLVLDLAFMPLFEDDPEQIAGANEEAAFWFRDVWRSSVKKSSGRPPSHLTRYYLCSTDVYYSDPDEARMQASLDNTAEVARHSRGSLQPFLPVDPRRWVKANRAKIPNRKFTDVIEYLRRYIFSKDVQATKQERYRGYAGIKLYTRHGWTLQGNKALYGDHIGSELDQLMQDVISFAVKHDIPLTNHHSPGGTPPNGFLVPTTEMAKRNYTRVPDPPTQNAKTATSYANWLAWTAAAETAYLCEYVERTASPSIWVPVLKRHAGLRLNLAHAGSAAAMYSHLGTTQCLRDVKLVMNRLLKRSGANDVTEYGVPLRDVEYLLRLPMLVQSEIFEEVFWQATTLRLYQYCQLVSKEPTLDPPNRFTCELTEQFRARWRDTLLHERSDCLLRWHAQSAAAEDASEGVEFCQTWPPLWNSELSTFVHNVESLTAEAIDRLRKDGHWRNWIATWWKKIEFDGKLDRKENWFETIMRLARTYENVFVDFSYVTGQRRMLWHRLANLDMSAVKADAAIAAALRTFFQDEALCEKAMFGSDWFLIEQDLGSADDAWRYFRACFQVARLNEDAWEAFSSTNALHFLNLESRIDSLRSFCTASQPHRLPWSWIVNVATPARHHPSTKVRNFLIDGRGTDPQTRAFRPARHDIGGTISLRAFVRHRDGGKVQWSVPVETTHLAVDSDASDVATSPDGQFLRVDGEVISLRALKPGTTEVVARYIDAQGEVKEVETYPIAVPQFALVTVDRERFFDALDVLGVRRIDAANVLSAAKIACRSALQGINVRTVWTGFQIGPLNEVLPKQFTDDPDSRDQYIIDARIEGSTERRKDRAGLARDKTFASRVIPGAHNNSCKVWPGNLLYPGSTDIDEALTLLKNASKRTDVHTTGATYALLTALVGRLTGAVLAHEIVHCLGRVGHPRKGTGKSHRMVDGKLQLDPSSKPPGVGIDLMNPGRQHDIRSRTGVEILDWDGFPQPGSYIDLGPEAIEKTDTEAVLSLKQLPTPPKFK